MVGIQAPVDPGEDVHARGGRVRLLHGEQRGSRVKGPQHAANTGVDRHYTAVQKADDENVLVSPVAWDMPGWRLDVSEL